MMKKIVLITLIVFVLLAIPVIIIGNFFDNSESTPIATVEKPPISEAEPTPPDTSPPADKLVCGSGGDCTVNQVAMHNSSPDCWVIYDAKVYDISNYNNHPGGEAAFDSSTCGGDITRQMIGLAGSDSLNEAHGHSQNAYQILESYFIANLSK